MAIVARVKHQPGDVQDYDIDFGMWFPEDDKVTWATVTSEPPMPEPNSVAIDPAKRIVKVWIYQNGVHGIDYKITIKATTTNDGLTTSPPLRTKEAELIVKVREI